MPAPMVHALLAMSLLTFVVFAWDKRRAIRGERRTSEGTLLLLSLLGGCAGAWLGMHAFRHKTRKRGFQIKMLSVTLIDAAALCAWFWLFR